MTLISEKTRLPLGLVAALIVGAAPLVGMAAVSHFKLNDTAARVERLESEGNSNERRIMRSEDALLEIREALKEIKADVKEVRRSRYRQPPPEREP